MKLFAGKNIFYERQGCACCSCVIKIKIHIHHSTDCALDSLSFYVCIPHHRRLLRLVFMTNWLGEEARRRTLKFIQSAWWTFFLFLFFPADSLPTRLSFSFLFLLNKHQHPRRTFLQAFKPPLDERPLVLQLLDFFPQNIKISFFFFFPLHSSLAHLFILSLALCQLKHLCTIGAAREKLNWGTSAYTRLRPLQLARLTMG